jgi:hypothetical protein
MSKKKQTPQDPTEFSLSDLGVNASPTDVVAIQKQDAFGRTRVGKRNYTALVKDDKMHAYADFELEVHPIQKTIKGEGVLVPTVCLVVRFVGRDDVGDMKVRQQIHGEEFSRLTKFTWPLCLAGPGSYFLQKFQEQNMAEVIADWYLASWATQGLDALVTKDQLKLLIDNATSQVMDEEPEMFDGKPVV